VLLPAASGLLVEKGDASQPAGPVHAGLASGLALGMKAPSGRRSNLSDMRASAGVSHPRKLLHSPPGMVHFPSVWSQRPTLSPSRGCERAALPGRHLPFPDMGGCCAQGSRGWRPTRRRAFGKACDHT
jgi:hypothetical protein